jgi:hypothetical protein
LYVGWSCGVDRSLDVTGNEVASIVHAQIGGHCEFRNSHGVDIARCLVPPVEIDIIFRRVRNGRISDEPLRVWLVLEERTGDRDCYRIVFNETLRSFGLVSAGFKTDPHPVLCGWYGDFLTALEAM